MAMYLVPIKQNTDENDKQWYSSINNNSLIYLCYKESLIKLVIYVT